MFNNSFNYTSYMKLVKELVSEGKSTGPDQSEMIVYYTGLNLVRMERINKVFTFTDELSGVINGLTKKYRFVVLTEAWCGDAAQIVPIFNYIEEAANGKIKLELLLRDENLELMDQYLTNGGRSIPKLIIYDEYNRVITTWGPRPQSLTEYMGQLKAENKDMELTEMMTKIQLWYSKDRTLSTQKELSELIKSLD